MVAAFSIAAVTAALKSRIENWLVEQNIGAHLGADVVVSALPPDRISTAADERPQINLFLSTLTPNTALHRTVFPFDLHYLITAYGSADFQHELLLGVVIDAMHNLEINAASLRVMIAALAAREHTSLWTAALEANLLGEHERLVAKPQFLTYEESGRIWSSLQARYRPSVAYRITAQTRDEVAR